MTKKKLPLLNKVSFLSKLATLLAPANEVNIWREARLNTGRANTVADQRAGKEKGANKAPKYLQA